MLLFEKAEWIWAEKPAEKDSYTDFISTFSCAENEQVFVRISADSDYTLWINGKLAGFGQYADYPSYKVGDTIDITEFVNPGSNLLALTVWYYGNNSSTYTLGQAGVIFEVGTAQKLLAYSSSDTLSRASRTYISSECHNITGQLGYTYHYDNTQNDAFITGESVQDFLPSRVITGITKSIHKRPIKRLNLENRVWGNIVQQGTFSYGDEAVDSIGLAMQQAALSHRPLRQMTGSSNRRMRDGITVSADKEGIYLILDLEEETVGFLDLDIETDNPCRIDIGYGEHLLDGRCRTAVGGRNFSCAVDVAAGRTHYLNTFRRFGCRYLQFFIHASNVKLHYIGLRPVTYPLTYKNFKSGNLLRDTIYRVCQKTMDCCMHVHYEDCPWREQALYTMDSRNQMLCGYYAFGEKDFARASLNLIANGLRPDGLLSICYPSGSPTCIPSFSLVYFLQMYEYIEYTADLSVAQENFSVLETLLATFASKTCANGLIENFYGEGKGYWNFYEWSPNLSGKFNETNRQIEAPLNAFYSIALQNMEKICRALGKKAEAEACAKKAAALNQAIASVFFEPSIGLFRTFAEAEASHGTYDVLTNALCLYCGAAQACNMDVILKILQANGPADTGLTVHPNTLSMNSFRFDALLAVDKEKYGNVILSELDRVYFSMLRRDATTFWETILGEEDFSNAGSLCHGWSALPIYYYEILQ